MSETPRRSAFKGSLYIKHFLFLLKDEGVRSPKVIWTPICKDVTPYLDFMRHLILL